MRLIDADELMEHVWRDKLDCRGLIAEMVNKAPTVKEIPTNIPISIFERLISQEPCSNCCDGNQIEKAKLCQKSYLAGMEHKQEACEDVISRQEVLKYFEGWKNQVKYYHPYAKNFDIPYEEAIQRIKDVPPVKCVSLEKPNKCEDAISRRMVLDATVNKNSIWNNITNAKGENLEEIISQLPPINQMNKWIGAEVLDDIKADIEHMIPCSKETLSMKLGVLEIIGKYMAESEEDENDKDN